MLSGKYLFLPSMQFGDRHLQNLTHTKHGLPLAKTASIQFSSVSKEWGVTSFLTQFR